MLFSMPKPSSYLSELCFKELKLYDDDNKWRVSALTAGWNVLVEIGQNGIDYSMAATTDTYGCVQSFYKYAALFLHQLPDVSLLLYIFGVSSSVSLTIPTILTTRRSLPRGAQTEGLAWRRALYCKEKNALTERAHRKEPLGLAVVARK